MESRNKSLAKRAAALMLGIVMLTPLGMVALPRPAHAQLLVHDPINLVENAISAVGSAAAHTKDYVLDTLAWQVAKLAIQSMTKSLVTWINSGFQGKPAFVTDLKRNLRGVGDAVANRFFEELSSETIAKTPSQDKILDGVRLAYYLSTSPESFYTRHPYTLDQVSYNDRAFLQGDFSQGGWNAWFATVMNPTNNPYAAQELINRELSTAISGEQAARTEELNWNKGFLSWRGDCTSAQHADGSVTSGASVDLSDTDKCIGYEVQTPGSVIVDQLNKTLGANVDSLVTADEFNEVIGALMNQLVGHVLGVNDNKGLRGVSQASSGGGSSFLDQSTGTAQWASTNASTESNLSSTVSNQKTYIAEYQKSWQKILDAASNAKAKCGADTGTPTPASVIDQATIALGKAASANDALDGIATRIGNAKSAGGDQTTALITLANDYQTLIASDTLPTSQELTDAQNQAQDSGDATPMSLYTSMTKMIDTNTSCVTSL